MTMKTKHIARKATMHDLPEDDVFKVLRQSKLPNPSPRMSDVI